MIFRNFGLVKEAAVIIAAFFISCQQETHNLELDQLTADGKPGSVEIAEEVVIVYTDSGIIRARIFARVMKRYPDAKDPYLEMGDGVRAIFFDEYGEKQSTLEAGYAVNYENKDLIIIRDSVRVVNKHDEEIKTEELFWDKKERRIYSDKDVRIREGNEKILYGKGFESNETFTKYRIKDLQGTVLIDDDTENEPE
jgi:LPS export ABC transporter protein LptC